MAPLLLLLETNTEAQGVAVTRVEVAALGGTQERPAVVPGTTPLNPVRARCRTLGVGNRTPWVFRVPIRTPLPNVAVHVVKAPRVGGVTADRRGLLQTLTITIKRIVGIRFRNRITP